MVKKKGKIDKSEKELALCKREKAEYLEGWQRCKAELMNLGKEEGERMQEFLRFATAGIILKLLPVLDNFDLAEKALSNEQKKEEGVKGLLRIKKILGDILKKEGLCKIELMGKKFEPEFAESVGEMKKKDVEPGTIVEVVRKGYELRGKIVRPAKVIVSK